MEIKHKACPCPNCIAVLSLLVNLWVDCPQFLSLSKKKHLLVLYTERERERESHTVTDGWIKDAVGFGRVAEERRGAKDAHHLAMTNHLFPYKSYTGHHHTQMVKKGWVIFTAHTVPAKKKKLHGAMDQVHCGLRPRTPAHYHHGSMASSVWSTANGFFMFMRGPFSCSSATDMANLYLPKWFIFLDIQWSLWIVEIDSDCSSFLASLVDHINITHK